MCRVGLRMRQAPILFSHMYERTNASLKKIWELVLRLWLWSARCPPLTYCCARCVHLYKLSHHYTDSILTSLIGIEPYSHRNHDKPLPLLRSLRWYITTPMPLLSSVLLMTAWIYDQIQLLHQAKHYVLLPIATRKSKDTKLPHYPRFHKVIDEEILHL